MDKDIWLKNLFMSYEARLFRYAARTINKEIARELVQETFLKLFKESPEKILGREAEWLFCVCRNLMMDHLKKSSSKNEFTTDDLGGVDVQATPEDKIYEHQKNSKINQLMSQLPKEKQEVIKLKFQEGFSYKEISTITGHSVSYVGVLIHEAMQFLKSEIATHSHKPGGAL